MEYRTTHGKVLAKLEKKKHEKERKKTKGKFIVSAVHIQWNPSKTVTVGTNAFVLHSGGVPNSGVNYKPQPFLIVAVYNRARMQMTITDSRFEVYCS